MVQQQQYVQQAKMLMLFYFVLLLRVVVPRAVLFFIYGIPCKLVGPIVVMAINTLDIIGGKFSPLTRIQQLSHPTKKWSQSCATDIIVAIQVIDNQLRVTLNGQASDVM